MTTEAGDDARRQKQVPYLFVRGNNYQVGFSIGRTFRSLIEDFLSDYAYLEKEILPVYNTPEGKKTYESSLAVCQQRFPQYVQELQGISEGSRIPFHKLFLLHIENFMVPYDPDDDDGPASEPPRSDEGSKGCTSILSHDGQNVILGHTEDALLQITNNFYIISAEVTDDSGEILVEKFTTLSYPGQLLGGTMGYNHFGLVHTINSIFPKQVFPSRTPHLFLLRALLGARTLGQVEEVLRDEGCGTADGFSVNLVIRDNNESGFVGESSPLVLNIEVSPSQSEGKAESELNIQKIFKGQSYAHCNQYLRCTTPEKVWFMSSSHQRHETINKFPGPWSLEKVQEILSEEVADGLDKVKYSIFKRALKPDDHYATVAVGIFDLAGKTWSIYTHPPKKFPPVAVLPLKFEGGL